MVRWSSTSGDTPKFHGYRGGLFEEKHSAGREVNGICARRAAGRLGRQPRNARRLEDQELLGYPMGRARLHVDGPRQQPVRDARRSGFVP